MSFARNEDVLAIVTGATGGIGREICRRLAQDGFDIVAQYHKNVDAARALQNDISNQGRRCRIVQANLSTSSGVDEVCAAIDDELKYANGSSLKLLVNNAAKLLGPSFATATYEQFDQYFAVNTRAPFFLSQRVSERLSSGASIVNISSASAHLSSPGDIVYAMSKSAVESMTRNMAEAVSARSIRVNAIIPGFTDNGNPAFNDPVALDYMSGFSVLGGVSEPQHIAEAVLFLASDAAARTTGSVLDVSGGSTLGARGTRAHSVRDLL